MLRASSAISTAIVCATFLFVAGPWTMAQEGQVAVLPDDPIASSAYQALERNCARCHQDGRLGDRAKPAGNFGFVLELEQLASDPHFVIPGNPDGSRIIQMILNEEMPYDVFYDGRFDIEPVSADEFGAIRAWIEDLGSRSRTACADSAAKRLDQVVSDILGDLRSVEKDRAAGTRYLTLTHLANACAEPDKLNVFTQGAVKLLNSLSRNSTVIKLETIDTEETILRFNIRDLGWTASDWDHVVAAYPYATLPGDDSAELLAAMTASPLPFVRADWFAATASQAPLYDILLDLPDDFAGLEKQQGVSVADNVREYLADRAGFQVSGVSANNRLIERHSIGTGYFWTSYDFAGNRDHQSLFEFPLGPGDGEFAFSHDGGETIFSLPNGFQGYYLNAADGTKLAQGPTAIVRDLSRADLAVTNGISCMGCHDQGMRKAVDEIRPHVVDNLTYPRHVRDSVSALYPTEDEMGAILEQDRRRFEFAMQAAGLDPSLKWQGIEMINALAQQYDQDVELAVAAAEFDQSEEEFVQSIKYAGDERVARLGRRLEQGLVPRDVIEGAFPTIVERVADLVLVTSVDRHDGDANAESVARKDKPPAAIDKAPRPIDLALTSDKTFYAQDDLATFTVTTDVACHLTLLNVDSSGEATVLFPNKFDSQNRLEAGEPFEFPSAQDGFPVQARGQGGGDRDRHLQSGRGRG